MASAAEQLAANINLGAFSKATELKKRLWFTLGVLVVYRLGTFIPIPGVDPVIMQDILYVIFNHSYMWCSEPFIYLILSPKEFGVWMLEVWPVNNKNWCEHLCFRGRHTVKAFEVEDEMDVDVEDDMDVDVEDDMDITIDEDKRTDAEEEGYKDGIKDAKADAEKTNEEMKDVKKELKEAYEAVKTLKNELNEINILNAKLLYTNKIFKSKNLNESNKVKVLTTFDKAETVKEAKLIYETLKDGLVSKKATKSINERIGMASKAAGIGPKKVKSVPIVESNEMVNRFKKLAGIIK